MAVFSVSAPAPAPTFGREVMSLALRWTASDDMPAVSEQRDKDPDWVGKRQEACFIVCGLQSYCVQSKKGLLTGMIGAKSSRLADGGRRRTTVCALGEPAQSGADD